MGETGGRVIERTTGRECAFGDGLATVWRKTGKEEFEAASSFVLFFVRTCASPRLRHADASTLGLPPRQLETSALTPTSPESSVLANLSDLATSDRFADATVFRPSTTPDFVTLTLATPLSVTLSSAVRSLSTT